MNKVLTSFIFTLLTMLIIACGDDAKQNNSGNNEAKATKKKETKKDNTPASQRIDLETKGVGPVKSLTLDDNIDNAMAEQGATIFKQKCSACHKVNKKFIGPGMTGIMKRRSPEWIMNMMLNPDEMVKKDPLAKALLIEFNGSPMANQNLTENDARAVLEYFRTLN